MSRGHLALFQVPNSAAVHDENAVQAYANQAALTSYKTSRETGILKLENTNTEASATESLSLLDLKAKYRDKPLDTNYLLMLYNLLASMICALDTLKKRETIHFDINPTTVKVCGFDRNFNLDNFNFAPDDFRNLHFALDDLGTKKTDISNLASFPIPKHAFCTAPEWRRTYVVVTKHRENVGNIDPWRLDPYAVGKVLEFMLPESIRVNEKQRNDIVELRKSHSRQQLVDFISGEEDFLERLFSQTERTRYDVQFDDRSLLKEPNLLMQLLLIIQWMVQEKSDDRVSLDELEAIINPVKINLETLLNGNNILVSRNQLRDVPASRANQEFPKPPHISCVTVKAAGNRYQLPPKLKIKPLGSDVSTPVTESGNHFPASIAIAENQAAFMAAQRAQSGLDSGDNSSIGSPIMPLAVAEKTLVSFDLDDAGFHEVIDKMVSSP